MPDKVSEVCERPDTWDYCPQEYCDVSQCGFWAMMYEVEQTERKS
jgi:hypothetical protein